jgi:hypothetical protein
MNSVIFFTIPEITCYITDFLTICDLDNLRLVSKDFAETFQYDQKRKLKQFKFSLNFRNDIFTRPYYPLKKLNEIYEEEKNKYQDGLRVDVFWNKELIGFVRYRTNPVIRNYWNGYLFQKTIKYDEDLHPMPCGKYKGCDMQMITYCQGNVLGFDHAHGWDFEEKNYTTLDMIKNEVIAMYLCCNELQPYPQYQ